MHAVQEAIRLEKCIPASSQPQRHGIDPGQPRRKSWYRMTDTTFDLIITVCDQVAGKSFPIFPGQPGKIRIEAFPTQPQAPKPT